MRVKIWGCRGSVPTPGPDTVGYGGNTSCIEVSLDNGAVLVLDAGTGIRELGLELQERETHSDPSPADPSASRPSRGASLLRATVRLAGDDRCVGTPLACADPAGADQALLLAAPVPHGPS